MTDAELEATIVASVKTAELAAILLAGRGLRAKDRPAMHAATHGEAAIEEAMYLLSLSTRGRRAQP